MFPGFGPDLSYPLLLSERVLVAPSASVFDNRIGSLGQLKVALWDLLAARVECESKHSTAEHVGLGGRWSYRRGATWLGASIVSLKLALQIRRRIGWRSFGDRDGSDRGASAIALD
jgi:hypothetical protein